jgi:hypothetical protein
MNLSEISFPVFRLGTNKPIEEGDLLYYSKEYVNIDNMETKASFRIVDDKSVPGANLGLRRLNIKASHPKLLYPMRTAFYFLGDLIKNAKSSTWYIDTTGKVFQYKKTTRAKLTCHKIEQVLPVSGLGAVITVEGMTQRFKCLYSPSKEQRFVGLLNLGMGRILYGFYEEQFKQSTRAV